MDTKLIFTEHDKKTTESQKTVVALSTLISNVGGPRCSKRRTLASLIHLQLLYAVSDCMRK